MLNDIDLINAEIDKRKVQNIVAQGFMGMEEMNHAPVFRVELACECRAPLVTKADGVLRYLNCDTPGTARRVG